MFVFFRLVSLAEVFLLTDKDSPFLNMRSKNGPKNHILPIRRTVLGKNYTGMPKNEKNFGG